MNRAESFQTKKKVQNFSFLSFFFLLFFRCTFTSSVIFFLIRVNSEKSKMQNQVCEMLVLFETYSCNFSALKNY